MKASIQEIDYMAMQQLMHKLLYNKIILEMI